MIEPITDMDFVALSIPAFLEANLEWVLAGVIVVVGLLGFGLSDVLRFSASRVWAISGVSFDESIRRRVLWITPLAILGVVIVSQLQHPVDEQDAIYQTTKFCLFATATLLVITTIILACTNLPKEIENRVIYTIVTKPTTRLEIVLGKILGFVRVSAAILVIMGLFSLGYLKLRSMKLERDIRQRLAAGAIEQTNRRTLEHYVNEGLLTARSVEHAQSLQFFAELPDPASDKRWMTGGNSEQSVMIPFDVTDADLTPPGEPNAAPGAAGLIVLARLDYRKSTAPPTETAPATRPFIPSPLRAATQPWRSPDAMAQDPTVQVDIVDAHGEVMLPAEQVNGGHPALLEAPNTTVQFPIDPGALGKISASTPAQLKRFYVRLTGLGNGLEYGIVPDSVRLIIPPTRPDVPPRILRSAANPNDPTQLLPMSFQGRFGTSGQQLRGRKDGRGAVAVYHYDNLPVKAGNDGRVPMEARIAIERGGDEDMSDDAATRLTVQTRNSKTGQLGSAIPLTPESRRLAFFTVPAQETEGGSFDLVIRCQSDGQWITLGDQSFGVVARQGSFAVNLLKSMLILWLMSVLVITISIFCSTFVSWPIAIVLTLVILLGRWGVMQLQDSLTSGIGHEVVNTWFPGSSPPVARTISTSVETLTRALNGLAKVLPDVERFPATDDIDQGLLIPWVRLLEALSVIGSFALPTAVLAFILLKYKEVAP